MKKLLVIDGNSILNRAFYGIRPLTTREGLHTNAVYGFSNILMRHLVAERPDYAVAAFDLPQPTFRHKAYDGYKANRHGMPDELAEQLPYAKEIAEALGFKVVACPGFEADDILGTYARLAGEVEAEAYLLTGDRDSLQLITDKTSVLLATTGETARMGRKEFFEKYGVMPEEFVDVKALMGDSSDCIPGVAGVGEKTALKLISTFHSLEGIYDYLDSPEITKSVRTKLEAGRDSAYMSRELAKIVTNAPVPELSEVEYHGILSSSMLELCTKLEFTAMIKKLGLNDAEAPSVPDESPCAGAPETHEIIEVTPENLLRVTAGEEPIALVLDCAEGAGLTLAAGGKILVSQGNDLRDFGEFLTKNAHRLVVYDSKALFARLEEVGIRLASVRSDVLLAAYVKNPSDNSYEPEKLALSYLGMSALPEGNAALASLYLSLAEKLEGELEAEGALPLYHDIELPLARVLCDMEREGFLCDLEGIREFGERLGYAIDRLAEEIYELAGCTFNINSPKQLGEVLFVKLAFPGFKKTKSGYSTSAEILEKLEPYHPIIRKILDYRQYSKLKSTYADGLLKVADGKGRIHTSFNQTITATGRLSSTEPNLQNIPVRTELGREMRRFFIAGGEDRVLIDADYSQIELRLLAHVSGDETMIEAFRREDDIHTITASQVFDVPPEAVTPELRKRAKAVNFGIVYGIGDFSLSRDIGVTKAEAARYIDSYLGKYPKVDAYLKNVIDDAKRDGFVTTILGRRRYIPELRSGKKALAAFGERVAMNSPIQGSAADIIKLAMINTSRALKAAGLDARLILQVHDELILDSAKACADEAAAILRREMETVLELSVPLTTDVQIASSWYDAH